jgi:hypothetical protein
MHIIKVQVAIVVIWGLLSSARSSGGILMFDIYFILIIVISVTVYVVDGFLCFVELRKVGQSAMFFRHSRMINPDCHHGNLAQQSNPRLASNMPSVSATGSLQWTL